MGYTVRQGTWQKPTPSGRGVEAKEAPCQEVVEGGDLTLEQAWRQAQTNASRQGGGTPQEPVLTAGWGECLEAAVAWLEKQDRPQTAKRLREALE